MTQTNSLFDYAPGQTTATFTDPNFPADPITLDDLPASVVAQAAALVAAAGITDPVTARSAELDYLATGDPSFIAADANIDQTYAQTSRRPSNPSAKPAAIGVAANAAKVTEAASGQTAVTFTAYLTEAASTATTIDYAVIAPGDGSARLAVRRRRHGVGHHRGRADDGAVHPRSSQRRARRVAGKDARSCRSVRPAALHPVFAPTAQTEIVNNTPEPGAAAVAQLAYLGNDGAFSFDAATNTYTLDLAGVSQGAAVSAQQFAVVNAAANGADNLGGKLHVADRPGFYRHGQCARLAARGRAELQRPLCLGEHGPLGANGMTLTFNPLDVNDSGFSQALTPLKLKIVDSVVARAAPRINTPSTIIFPAVHVGAVVSQHVSVTNTAAAGAANLDVSLSANGGALAQGSVAAASRPARPTRRASASASTLIRPARSPAR